MKAFLTRIDRFLDLFDRYVRVEEANFERSKARDEEQARFFQRQAEAAENIASSSHAGLQVSRRTAEAIERSIRPGYGDE
jgi:hypothetical protein